MSRPYRHVDTETLKKSHADLYARIENYNLRGHRSLVWGERRELGKVAKELDRRKNGAQYQQ